MSFNKSFQTIAIVLKSFDLGESDKIFTLLSKDRGLIKSVAKGIKKTTSKFSGMLDLLNANELVITEGKSNLSVIIQCESYKTFPKLRLDYDKLIYSLYLGELITLFPDNNASESIFSLFVTTLELIENSDLPIIFIIWFEIQFLRLLGYQPNFTMCDICQCDLSDNNENIGFSFEAGSIICRKCLNLARNYKRVSPQTIYILENLNSLGKNEMEKISNFKIDVLETAQNLLKEYFSHLSEKKIKTLSVIENSI